MYGATGNNNVHSTLYLTDEITSTLNNALSTFSITIDSYVQAQLRMTRTDDILDSVKDQPTDSGTKQNQHIAFSVHCVSKIYLEDKQYIYIHPTCFDRYCII